MLRLLKKKPLYGDGVLILGKRGVPFVGGECQRGRGTPCTGLRTFGNGGGSVHCVSVDDLDAAETVCVTFTVTRLLRDARFNSRRPPPGETHDPKARLPMASAKTMSKRRIDYSSVSRPGPLIRKTRLGCDERDLVCVRNTRVVCSIACYGYGRQWHRRMARAGKESKQCRFSEKKIFLAAIFSTSCRVVLLVHLRLSLVSIL